LLPAAAAETDDARRAACPPCAHPTPTA